ncbi:MAG: hypothetical protein NXH75_06950 [Halobacteriovoraceae bacterium]|nr:hypothetical protein [Halobacteriovoraceae bacterium]
MNENLNEAFEKEFLKSVDRFQKGHLKRYKYFISGYHFSEQQMKSYVTVAIDKISDGLFMQEPPTKRKDSKGRVDYVFAFKGNVVALEIKHRWSSIALSKDNTPTFKRRSSIDGFIKGLEQINDLDEGFLEEWEIDSKMSLTISPCFMNLCPKKHKNLESKIYKDIQKETEIKKVLEEGFKIKSKELGLKKGQWDQKLFNIVKYPFNLKNFYQKIEKGKKFNQFYPFVNFLWSQKRV